ncbi:hypothetical protein HPB50_014489 [Hyalomma asiaticum]|uniref:Uncharacterized protein n=1 Tax=Hyalomma asiaticum TaxID=266040 RepID=A0ACB7SFP0_HYAAI|nr:hypothetical protein HPB50_014489 [Hyalomma asiaticum]
MGPARAMTLKADEAKTLEGTERKPQISKTRKQFLQPPSSLLLVLSGDVEDDPGSDTNSTLAKALETVEQIEADQDNIMKDIQAQASADVELTARVRTIEVDDIALKANPVVTSFGSADSADNFSDKLKSIEHRCDDT